MPAARALSGRAGASFGGRPRPRLASLVRAALRASFHARRRTSSRASVAHFTTWNGSATRTAFGQVAATMESMKSAPSALTWVICPHRGTRTSRGGPHQPAGVMVDHDHQVLVALLVADLVDPDPAQVREPVGLG